MDDFIHNSMNTQVGIRLSISWSIMQALLFPSQKQAMNEAFLILFFLTSCCCRDGEYNSSPAYHSHLPTLALSIMKY